MIYISLLQNIDFSPNNLEKVDEGFDIRYTKKVQKEDLFNWIRLKTDLNLGICELEEFPKRNEIIKCAIKVLSLDKEHPDHIGFHDCMLFLSESLEYLIVVSEKDLRELFSFPIHKIVEVLKTYFKIIKGGGRFAYYGIFDLHKKEMIESGFSSHKSFKRWRSMRDTDILPERIIVKKKHSMEDDLFKMFGKGVKQKHSKHVFSDDGRFLLLYSYSD